ncbi:MAG: enoyl-CoA hydratase/isomerase family protein [Dehalococcoidia bacterium]|nr:enoyl-CoA hydratase/isomerase family protein [Dehalococcoidia bacterium]
MEYRDLLFDVSDHIATITLNRPERLNAISGGMLASFSDALRESDHDRDVRAIIITGAGRGFCSGLDLKEQGERSSRDGVNGAEAASSAARFDLASSPPIVLHQTDKPVICALNGAAAGYGMDLALGCDIRIASDQAKLAAVFTKRGVLPESGGAWLLPRLIGWSKAAEIAFLGKVLGAQECLELGLVSRVVPAESLIDEARAMAAEIARNAPLAVQATKRMMRLALEETFEASVHHVYLQLLPLFGSRDFHEGVQAFIERREPHFEGR